MVDRGGHHLGAERVLQHLAEHSGAALGGHRCPPHDATVLGTGERHVQQATLFVGGLGRRGSTQLLGGCCAALPGDPRRVDEPAGGGGGVGRAGVAAGLGPQVGAQHHAELEALGAVRREHLHRVVVAVDTPRHHRIGVVGVAEGSRVGEQAADRRRRRRTAAGCLLQQLGDVLDVGEVALAAAACQQPRPQAVGPHGGQQRRHTTPRHQRRPLAQQLVQPGQRGVVECGEFGGGVPDEPAERCSAGRTSRAGPFERVEQHLPLQHRCGVEHAGGTGGGRRDAGCTEVGDGEVGIAVAAGEHGDVACSQRSPAAVDGVDRGLRGEQMTHHGHDVVADGPASRRCTEHVVVLRHHPDLDGGRRGVGGGERHEVDATRMVLGGGHHRLEAHGIGAEGEAVEEAFEPGQHRAVGAAVHLEGADAVGGGERIEVGRQFGPAEPVDRLLRIAHEHDGRCILTAHEQALEQFPLHPVGVLELVDQHHSITRSQCCDELTGIGTGNQVAGVDHHPVECAGAGGGPAGEHLGDGCVDEVGSGHRAGSSHRFAGGAFRQHLVRVVALHPGIGQREPGGHRLGERRRLHRVEQLALRVAGCCTCDE